MYESLQETRETLLKLRPNSRKNWIALAVAYQLNGNLAGSKKVLEGYERTLKVCESSCRLQAAYAHGIGRMYPITTRSTLKS